jgi:hypothetical protein
MAKIRSKYQIWDTGRLVPAWTRKPKKIDGVVNLTVRDLTEQRLGIRWYLPAKTLEEMEAQRQTGQ